MADFPLPVKAEMSDAMKLPSRDLQFGDGYEQLGSEGLNRIEETWEVTVIIANPATSDLFQAFAIEHGQHKPFQWQSPRDNGSKNYVIDGAIGGTRRNGGGSKPLFFTRSMRFKRFRAIPVPEFLTVAPENFDENVLNPTFLMSTNDANTVFTLVSGNGSTNNSNFTIVGSQLRFSGTANYEAKSSYSIRIRATLQLGGFTEKALKIDVNDLNEAPTQLIVDGIPIPPFYPGPTFSFNRPVLFPVSSGVIQDNYGRISYGGGGGGGGGFGSTISGGYASSVVFTATATGEQTGTILLLENNPNPTIVANLSNDDPDTVDTTTYQLVAGLGDDDNAVFSISDSYLVINTTTDYEVKNEYQVRIRVTDNGGFFVDLPVRINIVQIPEYPYNISFSGGIIGAVNEIVGTLTATDPDEFSSFIYTIVGGTLANYLSVNGNTIVLTSSISGTGLTKYTVLIRATDDSGLFIEQLLILDLQKLNIRVINSNILEGTSLLISNTFSSRITTALAYPVSNTFSSTITTALAYPVSNTFSSRITTALAYPVSNTFSST